MDIDGRLGPCSTIGADAREAIDRLDRGYGGMSRGRPITGRRGAVGYLVNLSGDIVASPPPGQAHFPRPAAERRSSVASPSRWSHARLMSAALEIDLLDYDFHLFDEARHRDRPSGVGPRAIALLSGRHSSVSIWPHSSFLSLSAASGAVPARRRRHGAIEPPRRAGSCSMSMPPKGAHTSVPPLTTATTGSITRQGEMSRCAHLLRQEMVHDKQPLHRSVVVGIDLLPAPAIPAADRAVDEAVSRNVPLRLVCVTNVTHPSFDDYDVIKAAEVSLRTAQAAVERRRKAGEGRTAMSRAARRLRDAPSPLTPTCYVLAPLRIRRYRALLGRPRQSRRTCARPCRDDRGWPATTCPISTRWTCRWTTRRVAAAGARSWDAFFMEVPWQRGTDGATAADAGDQRGPEPRWAGSAPMRGAWHHRLADPPAALVRCHRGWPAWPHGPPTPG